MTASIRNLTFIVAVVVLVFILAPTLNSVFRGERTITSLGILGMELTLAEAVNREAPKEGQRDQSPSGNLASAAKALDTGGELWCFVGTRRDGQYVSAYFDVSDVPKDGDIITAKTDVYRRARAPLFTSDGWTLGQVEGLVRSGESIRVTSINRVKAGGGGTHDWVRGAVTSE